MVFLGDYLTINYCDEAGDYVTNKYLEQIGSNFILLCVEHNINKQNRIFGIKAMAATAARDSLNKSVVFNNFYFLKIDSEH